MSIGLGLGLTIGLRPAGGGAAFVGAYDAIPSITAAFGMRRLLSTYTGALLRLRRSNDNAESDFGYVANGDLDAAAIAAWLGANSGLVTTWYDQSGGGKNAVQTTALAQPLYVASGQNSKPVLRFDGSNDTVVATIPGGAQPFTALGVARRVGNIGRLIDTRPARILFGLGDGVTNQYDLYAGSVKKGGTPGTTWHVVVVQFNGASSLMRADGAGVIADNPGANALGTALNFAFDGNAVYSQMDIAEFVLTMTAWSAPHYQAAEQAANAYWSLYA